MTAPPIAINGPRVRDVALILRDVGNRQGNDAWGFVDSLRTLRLVNSADTWFVGKGASGSVVWVRGDGTRYCCDSATARAIRSGRRNLRGLAACRS